jgi:hypothetical protein
MHQRNKDQHERERERGLVGRKRESACVNAEVDVSPTSCGRGGGRATGSRTEPYRKNGKDGHASTRASSTLTVCTGGTTLRIIRGQWLLAGFDQGGEVLQTRNIYIPVSHQMAKEM